MSLDEVASRFVREVVMPKLEVIDKPGFIMMKPFTMGRLYLRQLLLPESFFVELEDRIYEKYSTNGKKALYTCGKKFGYMAAIAMSPSRAKKTPKEIFTKLASFFVRFIECTYASEIFHEINTDSSEFRMKMNEYVICRRNGRGYILTEGGITGIWAYVMENPMIEGVQIQCQGRGDKKCELICAPLNNLSQKNLDALVMDDLSGLELDRSYGEKNKIVEVKYAKNSLKDLINTKFFSHSQGVIEHKSERYFLNEASIIYLLELELEKLEGARDILLECAFNHGKKIAEKEENAKYQEFIPQYLSACGWGDILLTKNSEGGCKIVSYHHPWTKFADKSKFVIFQGITSGLLSGFLKEKIILDHVSSETLSGYLTVALS